MEIVVLSRAKAKRFGPSKPWAAISIAACSAGPMNLAEEFPELNSAYREGLLQLYFDDTDRKREGCFTPRQAEDILRFVQELFPKIEILMIHCHAGASRSPAVAAALYKLISNQDDSHYFKVYTPNALVYSTILKVAIERLGILPGHLIASGSP